MRAVAPSSPSGDASPDTGPFLFRRGLGPGEAQNELGFAAPQPQLHRAGRQLAGDLLGCSDKDVLQGEAYGRLERGEKPLGLRLCLVSSCLCRGRRTAKNALDVLGQLHDAIMASL